MCQERELLLKLNFCHLIEQHRSWDSISISIYWIDFNDLKTEMRMWESGEIHDVFKYEFSFNSIEVFKHQPPLLHAPFWRMRCKLSSPVLNGPLTSQS